MGCSNSNQEPKYNPTDDDFDETTLNHHVTQFQKENINHPISQFKKEKVEREFEFEEADDPDKYTIKVREENIVGSASESVKPWEMNDLKNSSIVRNIFEDPDHGFSPDCKIDCFEKVIKDIDIKVAEGKTFTEDGRCKHSCNLTVAGKVVEGMARIVDGYHDSSGCKAIKPWVLNDLKQSSRIKHIMEPNDPKKKLMHAFGPNCGMPCVTEVTKHIEVKQKNGRDYNEPGRCKHGCTIIIRFSVINGEARPGTAFHEGGHCKKP